MSSAWLRRFGAVAAVTFVVPAISLAQSPLDDLPALPTPLGAITDQNDPRWSKPMVATLVSNPIEPDELRDYALILHLSAEQCHLARDAYLAYRLRTDDLNSKYQGPVADFAHEGADFQSHPQDWEYLRLMTELRKTEGEYQRELDAQDKQFLSAMEVLLSDPQKERFERVTLRRARKRCQPNLIVISPGYIDLVDLVERHIKDPDVLGDLDPMLLEYERLITPLYLEIDESKRRDEMLETRELVAARYSEDGKTRLEMNSPEWEAAFQRFIQKRQKVLAQTIPEQERVADINRQFIERIREPIPAADFKPLWNEYLASSFPYIHPDHCDPTELLLSMLAAEGLDQDIRTLMQARFDSWRKTYDTMTGEMERHYIEYNKIFARTFASEAEHTPAIRKLRIDRWNASEEAVKAIHGMLPGPIKPGFDVEVRYYQQRLARERESETNPRCGNP